MRCPSLAELPPPPPGKTGWPWLVESEPLPDHMSDGRPWPRVSVVTPSFKQAAFLEATLRSVLLQGYPDLEYVVIDGGSADGSVDILRKYEPWLAYWVSERDRGQYDAINKGLSRTTGEVMAWINSDDMLLPGGLTIVAQALSQQGMDWVIGVPTFWNEQGERSGTGKGRHRRRRFIRSGLYEGRRLGWIQQESTFWSRRAWNSAGGQLDDSLQLAADYALWRRFAAVNDLHQLDVPVSGFRMHGEQKTASRMAEYYREIDAQFSPTRPRDWLWYASRIGLVNRALKRLSR